MDPVTGTRSVVSHNAHPLGGPSFAEPTGMVLDVSGHLLVADAEAFQDGGPGNDRLYGLGGTDRLRGASGHDLLVGGRGRDRLDGGRGPDRIKSRDGVRDTVICGRGRDTVVADARDRLRGCERVRR